MKRFCVLMLALAASIADAGNVWEEAIAPDAAARDKYESELRQGDEQALLANTRGTANREVRNQVGLAAASYRAAAAAKPDEGEPYYRLGRLLYSFYLDCDRDPNSRLYRSALCDPNVLNRSRAEEVIEAWDAFEARTPLDPRLSVGALGDSEILFRRAILHTKLATKPHLEAAARDYEKILARQDSTDGDSHLVLGNLAETYMMLGKLDEAVETYKQALRTAHDTAVWYGYAVALDRDERTQQALDVIASLGKGQRDDFHNKVRKGDTFFVPDGEKYYYFALVDEALGLHDQALEYWQLFLNSGAHPQYQPRAKAHRDALAKKQRKALSIEHPLRGILR